MQLACMHILYVACRVFANAETLFYYAKKGRPSRRTLSQAEIQALLARTKISSIEKNMKKISRKESTPTIHEVDPLLEGEECPTENDFLLLSAGLGKKRDRKTTPTIHEIDIDSQRREGSLGEVERDLEGGNRSRNISESSDSVFTQSTPATPLSTGRNLSLAGESTTGQITPPQHPISGGEGSQDKGTSGNGTVQEDDVTVSSNIYVPA